MFLRKILPPASGLINKPSKHPTKASFCLLPADSLLGLIFSLEDGGGIFLQNISVFP
jgi:hypothetical protein